MRRERIILHERASIVGRRRSKGWWLSFNLWFFILSMFFFLPQQVTAHPPPSLAYDHTVLVQLSPKGVEAQYLLDVESVTVQFDLRHLLDPKEFAALRSEADVHAAFQKNVGPLLGERLVAFQGETPLIFEPVESRVDVLDHLRFTFVFRAKWANDLKRDAVFRMEVQRSLARGDSYFEQEKGQLYLGFLPNPFVVLRERNEPPFELKQKALPNLTEAEKTRVARVAARIEPSEVGLGCGLAGGSIYAVAAELGVLTPAPSVAKSPGNAPQWRLDRLLESGWGFGLSMLVAVGFGAAHALTPGHGKTLVGAYLVGQRGTVGHAVLLGAVTTITHTGIVILIAALLPLLARRVDHKQMQEILGFVGGALIAGMGVWLLLRRLSGKADHVHVGGGHHHHHDDSHHHHHLPADRPVRFWDLIVLGISGGIVPCWDAIALLGLAIATHRLWLGLPLLLAFSAGLAGVLVLIGILVVKLKGFGASRWGRGRLTRALPLISAVVITAIGIGLCFDSLSGH